MATGAPCLFLSPHLDDAILSCGALIKALADRCEVTVATIFTAAGAEPHTRAARSFMRQCSARDASSLFAARRTEDQEVLAGIGADHLHLGVPDALYRRRDSTSSVARSLGNLLPELVHRYPTYRFDIARGRVARGDRSLAARIVPQISELLAHTDAKTVFCPMGVGRHVDHIITRTIGEYYPDHAVYYSDFPYNQFLAPDHAFISRNKLVPWNWQQGINEKHNLIRGYRTQADALFPDGRIPVIPEVYYVAAP
ncbi:MAG: PIG-L deacetylase family protein [Pseudonocardiaceae bacterium]